jgi:hypothetical protein
LDKALTRIKDNKITEVATVKDGKLVPCVIHYLDDDLLRASKLRADYEMPLLHKFLRLQKTSLSIWPPIQHVTKSVLGETFMCVLDGSEEFRLMSPVFKQNLYSGVYDDLKPTDVPQDINLFHVNKDKYPLLAEAEPYILKAWLQAGDCIYIPAYYFMQTSTKSEQSIILTFGYESHSKLTDLLFDAINDGILDNK